MILTELSIPKRVVLAGVVLATLGTLSNLLGVHVDLSPAHVLKEPVRAKAAREAVLAF